VLGQDPLALRVVALLLALPALFARCRLFLRDAADESLRQRLEQLAKPNELRRWSVYRFQVR
jgi:hypothetical protein